MKRLLLFLLPLIALSAHAQGRHEVSVFVGGPAIEYVNSSRFEDSGIQDLYSMYEPRHYADGGFNFGADYTYAVLPWLKLGVQADMSVVSLRTYPPAIEDSNILYSNYITPSAKSSFVTAALLPEAKFFCLNKRFFKLYGKVAGGVCFAFSNVTSSRVAPAWEIAPVGVEVGGSFIYFTSEIAVGSEISGIRLGCGFRF